MNPYIDPSCLEGSDGPGNGSGGRGGGSAASSAIALCPFKKGLSGSSDLGGQTGSGPPSYTGWTSRIRFPGSRSFQNLIYRPKQPIALG